MESVTEQIVIGLQEKLSKETTGALGELATRHSEDVSSQEVIPQSAATQSTAEADPQPDAVDLDPAENDGPDETAAHITVDQLEAAFITHGPSMRDLARRMLGDDAGEDIAQEAFLRTILSIHNGQKVRPETLSGWLHTITARLAIDERRHRQRIHMRSLDAQLGNSDETHADFAVDPAASHTDKRIANRELIKDGLSVLTPDQQQMVLLRYWDGYGSNELAEHFRKSPGSFKMEMMRLRQVVRAKLQADGVSSAWQD